MDRKCESLKEQIKLAWNLDLILITDPKDEYEKVPIRHEVKSLVAMATQHCINNGIAPDCAIDGCEGLVSSEITSMSELEILDLIRNLEEIEDRKTSK